MRLPPLVVSEQSEDEESAAKENIAKESSEFTTISLVLDRTDIPVPKIYALEARKHVDVGSSFMLMECLRGNVGLDLGMDIPAQHRDAFLGELARVHVKLAAILLPKIGKIVGRDVDGSYVQGPIPGVGGPFDTATEYFSAWAAKASFGLTEKRLREVSGTYADQIVPSVASFPASVARLASLLSVKDHGPFPLCHGDFGHNNTVVDDDYRILGVIDWEAAFAGPWELFATYPLSLRMVPATMDAPSNYDENGELINPAMKERAVAQHTYMNAVAFEESRLGGDEPLSKALRDVKRLELVTAMRLYDTGKAGLYSKVVDNFETTA